MAYIPPECNDIPFIFSDSGYIPPVCNNVLFNFRPEARLSSLSAFINIVTKFDYVKDTYTYTKFCPTYIIGYNNSYQLLKESCTYGGIRGVAASIVATEAPILGTNLQASIRGFAKEALPSYISSHLHTSLISNIKPVVSSYSDMKSDVVGLTFNVIKASFKGTHLPVNLASQIHVKQRGNYGMLSSIHGVVTSDLTAMLNIIRHKVLISTISSIEPIKLRADLNIIEVNTIKSSIHGLTESGLSAYIKRIYKNTIQAKLNPVTDTNKRLSAMTKGIAMASSLINAAVQSYHIYGIGANLLSFYFSNISAHVKPVMPVTLPSTIHSWDHKGLLSTIIGDAYLWKLPATINASGSINNLKAAISIKRGKAYTKLPTIIHAWETVVLKGFISTEPAPVLLASINPVGNCRRLLCAITPKTIRLTTIIDVATMSSRVLSGMINSLCFNTGYKSLPSVISAVYKHDIVAYIKPVITTYNPTNLIATVGYTAYNSVENKLRLNINISDESIMVVDKYRFVINFLKNGSVLSAGIRGVLRSNPLRCSIVCREIPAYNFTLPTKNTEQVVHRSYDGNAIDYETVELAFNSIVKDYFYSSSGNELWKSDRLEKWSVGLKSILIENAPLRTKRILNKSTVLRNLKNFTSIDDAVKYAINYVTDRPSSCINAYVRPTGYYTSLISTITPKTFVRKESTLSAHIEAESVPIILSIGDTIIVI